MPFQAIKVPREGEKVSLVPGTKLQAKEVYGSKCPPSLLPEETGEAGREYVVAIQGPLTTPVGEGFRSLNVALRQIRYQTRLDRGIGTADQVSDKTVSCNSERLMTGAKLLRCSEFGEAIANDM